MQSRDEQCMSMKVDETMLDDLTAQYKTPEDAAALYTQMLQRVIDRGDSRGAAWNRPCCY